MRLPILNYLRQKGLKAVTFLNIQLSLAVIMESNVYYVEDKTSAFILFYGNAFKIEKLPRGTRVIYPPMPIMPLDNPHTVIENVLENPIGRKPLSHILKKGMSVTIAFDDLSLPLPPMKSPDLRQTAIEIILEKLKKAEIADIHLIAGICLHRKMSKEELVEMLGREIVDEYYPGRLYNHDAEDRDNMKYIGRTVNHEEVFINKRVAESDLVIYVNINFVSMDGGHKSFGTGLADYHTVRHNHNVDTLMHSLSYFDPEKSRMHHILERQGRLIEKSLNTFHLEMALNNDTFPEHLKFLQKRHYEMNALDKIACRVIAGLTSMMSAELQRKVAQSIRSNYGMISAYAGEVEAVHKKILEQNFRQYEVEVKGQCDILIGGIPDMSPYNVNSILNPVLFVCLVHGYFFNLYRNMPLLRKGGVLIAVHPLRNEFHKVHHPSYIDFYNNVLSKTLDTSEIENKFEKEFATNPEYIRLYRESNAFHGVHPFYMWYWGCYGLSYIGKTIVVGAKDRSVIERLKFGYARNVKEAVKIAKDFLKNDKPEITYIKVPPILSVHVK